MAGLYLDTSALGRVLLAEPDAAAIRATLVRYDGWWSSGLLIVELRRLAAREGLQAIAEGMLRGVRTVPVDGAALERSSAAAAARGPVARRWVGDDTRLRPCWPTVTRWR